MKKKINNDNKLLLVVIFGLRKSPPNIFPYLIQKKRENNYNCLNVSKFPIQTAPGRR